MINQQRLALLAALGFVCSAAIAGCSQEQSQPTASTVPPPAQASPAQATNVPGPFDGTWQIDAAPARTGSTSISDVSSCDGVRIQFEVKNNQVQGMLGRSTYGGGVTQSGRDVTPISGTVQPDGTINAQWQKYHATGKLTGDKAELHWKGTCGARVATGGRLGSQGSSTR